jgi:hypothetical protein
MVRETGEWRQDLLWMFAVWGGRDGFLAYFKTFRSQKHNVRGRAVL